MINLGVDIRERAAKMELNKKKLRLTKNTVEGEKTRRTRVFETHTLIDTEKANV